MDIRAYIESGVLEAYVLNQLSQAEREAVAEQIAASAEVAAEVAAIEAGLLAFARAHQMEPPAELSGSIWARLHENAQSPNAASERLVQKGAEPQIIPFDPHLLNSQRQQLHWQQAALILVLVSSVVVNIVFWLQQQRAAKENAVLIARIDSMATRQDDLRQLAAHYQKERDMMADTSMAAVLMKGVADGHMMAATVYWKRHSGESWLSLQKLPPPPKGMQYQMWAISNGRPKSMGVINTSTDEGMLAMSQKVMSAEGFAISLEPMGGSAAPTTVMVSGQIG